MSFSLFFFDYVRWHYMSGPQALLHIWFTLLCYIEQTLAIRLHLRTLFSPWHRVQEKSHRKFDIEDWTAKVLINIISRLLGFIFRGVLVITGLLVSLIHTIMLPIVLIIWLAAPVVLASLTLGGITLIFLSYGNPL